MTNRYYTEVCAYTEKKPRTEAPSMKKSPLPKPLQCDYTFELMLIVRSCF